MGKVLKLSKLTRLKNNKYGYNPYEDGVTQSLLTTWLTCPRKAALYLQGVTTTRESSAIVYGNLVHDILHHVIVEGIATEDVEKYTKFILNKYKKPFLKNGLWDSKQLEEFELMAVQISVTLTAYFEYWEEEDDKIKWTATEEEFKVPFGNTFLRGKLDGAQEHTVQRRKSEWLFETKTKGQIAEDKIADTLPFDFQTNTYTVARKLMTGKCPDGTIYNVIRRPGIKFTAKDKTLKGYAKRLKEHIDDKGYDYYFKRFESPIEPDEVQRFQDDLEMIVERFLEWWDNHDSEPDLLYGMPCEGSKYGVCSMLNWCHYNTRIGYYQRDRVFMELEGE